MKNNTFKRGQRVEFTSLAGTTVQATVYCRADGSNCYGLVPLEMPSAPNLTYAEGKHLRRVESTARKPCVTITVDGVITGIVGPFETEELAMGYIDEVQPHMAGATFCLTEIVGPGYILETMFPPK